MKISRQRVDELGLVITTTMMIEITHRTLQNVITARVISQAMEEI